MRYLAAAARQFDATGTWPQWPTDLPIPSPGSGEERRPRQAVPLAPKPADLPPTSVRDKTPTQRVVASYQAGKSQRQVAAALGIHVQTVRQHLRRAGVVVRTTRTVLSDSDLAEALAMANDGASLRALGRRFGVAHTTMARVLEREGAP